ncbi:MAG: GntR family transcriptional regulator [Planctomycetota bacterium]
MTRTSSQLAPVAAEPGRPLYVTVRETILRVVEAGGFGPGDRLPSTKAISQQMEVSLVTVHRALQDLVSAGVLLRGQGRGTFVHEDYLKRRGKLADMRLGLVFHAGSSLADSYHGLILEGVRARSAESGIDLVILRFGEDWRNECDGYLYVNPDPAVLVEDAVPGRPSSDPLQTDSPVVVVGAHLEGKRGLRSIDSDNEQIGRQAARHLVELGHSRFSFIGGDDSISNNRDRWIGFRDECARLDTDLDEDWVVRLNDWRLDDGSTERLYRIMSDPAGPTACFAAGYYFALGLYGVCSKLGRSIPDDLAVISVDDPPSAELLSPPLSTFRQPLTQMGAAAVDELMDAVRKHRTGDHPTETRRILPATFIPRASSSHDFDPAEAGARTRFGGTP